MSTGNYFFLLHSLHFVLLLVSIIIKKVEFPLHVYLCKLHYIKNRTTGYYLCLV